MLPNTPAPIVALPEDDHKYQYQFVPVPGRVVVAETYPVAKTGSRTSPPIRVGLDLIGPKRRETKDRWEKK
jgi:hypothetical protein